ncbi:MAG TPA: hypothetical protein VJX92_00650 [Methylomirabilota bacterium]|nr:hypothetical protein [Methylomirabilota bacterium]
MEVPSERSPQTRARRLGHRVAAGRLLLLRLAQTAPASARSVLEQLHHLGRRRRSVIIGVLIGLVLSAVCYWTVGAWQTRRLEERVSTSKTWPVASIPGDVTVEVTTRCRNSTLSYIVSIIPPPGASTLSLWDRTDQNKVATDQIRERFKSIRLQFSGKEGVPAADYELPMDDFVRIYSSRVDRPLTLEARGMLACDPRRYVREDTLKLDWLERPRPAEPARPAEIVHPAQQDEDHGAGTPESSHRPAERPEQEAG